MTDDDRNEPRPGAPPRLRAVHGPLASAEPPPEVRLLREWKGPTVADLLRDEFVERLPGQVRSALRHLERGDLAAADRALPGDHAPVLMGPGHVRFARRRAVLVVALAAALAASLLASWLSA